MKTITLLFVAVLLLSMFALNSCDYITGQKPLLSQPSDPTPQLNVPDVQPNTIEVSSKSDWKLKVTDLNLTSLSVIVGRVPNDKAIEVDISALTQLEHLTFLRLNSHSIIKDLSPIASLRNLTNLDLSIDSAWNYDPPINLSPLDSLQNLTSLTIHTTYTDIINSSNLTLSRNLASLDISVEKSYFTFDIASLVTCTNLVDLKLHCFLKNTDFFSSLKHLRSLDLSDNGFSNISYLKDCKSIIDLNLGNNSISDISSLSSLTNLDTLELKNNKLTDISPLSSLTKLSILDLRNNQIQEVSYLASLTNLKILKLSHNIIENVSALVSLKKMSSIWLGANKIKNITVLKEMPSLDEVLIDGNPLDDESVNELLDLKQNGTNVYYYAIEDSYKLIPLLFTDEENSGGYYLVNPVMELKTTFISETDEWYSSIQYLDQEFKAQGLDVSLLLEALIERNQEPVNLDIPSAKEDGYIIDNDGIFKSYFEDNTISGWQNIRKDLPDFRCYISISVPVYDKERNIFLVYLGWIGGGLMGSGDIYAFSYEKGKLVIIAGVQLWIS